MKCRENRRRRLKRRARHEARLAAREPVEQFTGWLCFCGHWEDSEFHCTCCCREPPWGCDCDAHNSYDELDDCDNEPIGWDVLPRTRDLFDEDEQPLEG